MHHLAQERTFLLLYDSQDAKLPGFNESLGTRRAGGTLGLHASCVHQLPSAGVGLPLGQITLVQLESEVCSQDSYPDSAHRQEILKFQ